MRTPQKPILFSLRHDHHPNLAGQNLPLTLWPIPHSYSICFCRLSMSCPTPCCIFFKVSLISWSRSSILAIFLLLQVKVTSGLVFFIGEKLNIEHILLIEVHTSIKDGIHLWVFLDRTEMNELF